MDIPALGARLRQHKAWIPSLAVVAVVVAALGAVWFATRPDATERGDRPPGPLEQPVVKAPPITTPNTAVAGGPPATRGDCPNCGVVESVAMLQNPKSFQLQIRMSDGSLRTVQQSVPLMAGSRVVLEGRAVKPLPAQAPQG